MYHNEHGKDELLNFDAVQTHAHTMKNTLQYIKLEFNSTHHDSNAIMLSHQTNEGLDRAFNPKKVMETW